MVIVNERLTPTRSPTPKRSYEPGLATSRRRVLCPALQRAGRSRMAAVAAVGEIHSTPCLDLEAFRRTALVREPFPFVVVPGFVAPAAQARLSADYPAIAQAGSFPLADLTYGAAFAAFVAELEGEAMRAAFAEKFAIDLAGRPTIITVRGHARAGDGSIHTDTKTKLITALIYMNEAWEAPGGRLRLLRAPDDLDSVIAEVPPAAGTLLAFRVTRNSWHGHAPASGPRRVVQLNWVVSGGVVRRDAGRSPGHGRARN